MSRISTAARRLAAGISAAILVSAGLVGPAAAKELVYGSWLGAKTGTNEKSLPTYFNAVKRDTNGEIEWNLVPGGQLASGPGTLEAVKNGLMDAANMIFSQSLLGDDVLAAAAAMNETVLLNCPECVEENRRNNAVGFAGYSVAPYALMCRREVRTVQELKGLKVRSSGGGVSIMNIAGATPVAMNPADATTALERGALDCVLGALAWLHNFGYMDVTRAVLDYPMGIGGPPYLMYVNRDAWQGMTPEQRRAHIDNAPLLVAVEVMDAQLAYQNEVVAEARKRGIIFHRGGDDFAAVMAERDRIQKNENIEVAKTAGVKNAGAILDAYLASYEKWKGLMAQIGDDRERYIEALKREIYDKLDPESL
jgi:TRAP-type transport system periplasmic protein